MLRVVNKIFPALLAALLLVSCGTSRQTVVTPDPADAFVGYYSFVDNYTSVLMGQPRQLVNEGFIRMEKIAPNQLRLSGAWTTVAIVEGGNLTLASEMQSNESGYINYVFEPATVVGNKLHFIYHGEGAMNLAGAACPWTINGVVEAKRQYK